MSGCKEKGPSSTPLGGGEVHGARLWSSVVQFLASGKPVPKTSGARSPARDRHSVVVGVSQGEKGTLANTRKSLHMLPRGPCDTTFSTAPAPSFTVNAAIAKSPTGCENLKHTTYADRCLMVDIHSRPFGAVTHRRYLLQYSGKVAVQL